jgi:hypothetical protein
MQMVPVVETLLVGGGCCERAGRQGVEGIGCWMLGRVVPTMQDSGQDIAYSENAAIVGDEVGRIRVRHSASSHTLGRHSVDQCTWTPKMRILLVVVDRVDSHVD